MNEKNANDCGTADKATKAGPITSVLGSHPVGTGLGAVGTGAAAGAAGGAIAGPVAAVVGAAAGAVVGGLAGKAAAEAINPTVETKFWRESYSGRPYADTKLGYDEFGPAYRYGWESFGSRAQGTTFESVEADLKQGWDKAKGSSRLGWDQAKSATHDAWNRVELAARGPKN